MKQPDSNYDMAEVVCAKNRYQYVEVLKKLHGPEEAKQLVENCESEKRIAQLAIDAKRWIEGRHPLQQSPR